MTPPLRYDVSVLIDSQTLAWEPYAPEGYRPGLRVRPLRRLDDGSLRSGVVDVPPGWSSGGARTTRAAEQGYVLSGQIEIAGVAFEAGSFYAVPAGAAFGPVRSAQGARMIVILEGEQAYFEVDASATGRIERVIAAEVPAIESVIDGRKIGVMRRVLWQDPVTGADTRHLTLPSGLAALGAEWHPVNEEIFFLTSSGRAESDGAGPGWFLFNPAYAVHGGKRTATTTERTLLEWHDSKWALNRP